MGKRHLYLWDCTGPKPVKRRRWNAEGLNDREVHELEQRVRRECPELDGASVFLRDSINDAGR